jgi:hypothetical protein
MTLAVGAVYPLYMKLDIVGTANRRTAEPQNIECRMVESLRSVFFKIDRIHYFDIRHSIFAFSEFLFRLDQLFFLTGGWADT